MVRTFGLTHISLAVEDAERSPADIDLAVAEVERAGGKILRRGEFSPGYPYACVEDPDGTRSRSGMSRRPRE